MIYMDVFILYEYHGNIGFWVWWWSGEVNNKGYLRLCISYYSSYGYGHGLPVYDVFSGARRVGTVDVPRPAFL